MFPLPSYVKVRSPTPAGRTRCTAPGPVTCKHLVGAGIAREALRLPERIDHIGDKALHVEPVGGWLPSIGDGRRDHRAGGDLGFASV
jgi:hypothetical protein